MPAGAAGLPNLPIPDSRPVVKIGVFDTFGTSFVNETVDPTLAVIQAKLPRYRFELDVIAASNPEDAVKSSGVDFFVSSAGVYSTLERTVGAAHRDPPPGGCRGPCTECRRGVCGEKRPQGSEDAC
ncbi:MAG: hypothetical protein V8S69_02850 [Dakarella massiliensis]